MEQTSQTNYLINVGDMRHTGPLIYGVLHPQPRGVNLSSEVIDSRHVSLPDGHAAWVNTSASGRLTIEQAEAFVELIQRAIEDAKGR